MPLWDDDPFTKRRFSAKMKYRTKDRCKKCEKTAKDRCKKCKYRQKFVVYFAV